MSAVKRRAKFSSGKIKPELKRAEKSGDAFRTISEVADDIEVPQHVLRFWETKFPQVKPMKRGGGRRYYRPEDVEVLRVIRELLYDQGYTIKGVQKLIRNGGLRLAGLTGASSPIVEEVIIDEIDGGQEEEFDALPLFQNSTLNAQQIMELKLITDELLELREKLGQVLQKTDFLIE